jgi:imidazolonepropionase-like amidohydrolase
MPHSHLVIALLLALIASPIDAQTASTTLLLSGGNIVDLETGKVCSGCDLLINSGKIKEVGEKIAAPKGVRRIDVRGKVLVPGFIDMHAHVGGPAWSESQMKLLVSYGITTARGMVGQVEQLKLRERIDRGEQLGPQLVLAGPPLFGNNAKDPETARALVREHKAAGFDYIKVVAGFSPEVYDAIIETAKENSIEVVGHVDPKVGLEHAFAAHQRSFEHLDSFLEATVSDSAPVKISDSQVFPGKVVHYVDAKKLKAVAAKSAQQDGCFTPTLSLFETFNSPKEQLNIASSEGFDLLPPKIQEMWRKQEQELRADKEIDPADSAQLIKVRRQFARALSDAGAKIVIGSDSPQPGNAPGASFHGEARALERAGLTPAQILRAGTVAAANCLRKNDRGVLKAGTRADVVVLSADPLRSASNLHEIDAVVISGDYLDRARLRRLREEARAAVASVK